MGGVSVMKILLTGGRGMLGRTIERVLVEPFRVLFTLSYQSRNYM